MIRSAEAAPPTRRIDVFDDLEALSDAAARAFVEVAQESVRLHDRFAVALAGGSTPLRAYELIAERYVADVPWNRTDVFFSDERCVPPDDALSNYAAARIALLSRVPLEPSRVHPIPAFGVEPAVGAERYEDALKRRFQSTGEMSRGTAFDLALLGVGADGHTASLFPGDAAVAERRRWVVAVEAPPGIVPTARITLTPAVLDRSRHLFILAAGAPKRRAIAAALAPGGRGEDRSVPVRGLSGITSTRWLIDAAAAPRR